MKDFLVHHHKKLKIATLIIIVIALLTLGLFLILSKNSLFSPKKGSSVEPFAEVIHTESNPPEEITFEIPEIPENSTEEIPKNTEEKTDSTIEAESENAEETEPTEAENEDADNSEEGEKKEESEILPLPSRSYDPDELRIGFLTDLHADSKSNTSRSDRRIKPYYQNVVNNFIETVNNELIADFIVLNGDVIDGTNRDDIVGTGELRSLKKLFERTQIKKYWVIGNHDLRAVNKKQWKKALEIDYLHNSFDVGNYRIILLDSSFDKNDNDIKPGTYYTRGKVSEKQIDWLKRKLDTNKTKIVFMHNPPLKGLGFHSNSGLLYNALELQEVFSDNDVTAVFCGHLEYLFNQEVDGVKYFMLPGSTKNEDYQGTFAEIRLKKEKIDIDIHYLDKNENYKSKDVY
jgi:hypothetical protein